MCSCGLGFHGEFPGGGDFNTFEKKIIFQLQKSGILTNSVGFVGPKRHGAENPMDFVASPKPFESCHVKRWATSTCWDAVSFKFGNAGNVFTWFLFKQLTS